jgi:molecular chaperone GrpE
MTDEVTTDEQQAAEQLDESQATSELEAVKAERDELLDTLQRVQAEFDNYRKRAARDQESLVARAHERLVRELLPVVDGLERAVEAAKPLEPPVRESGRGEGVRGNRAEVPPTDADRSKLEEGVALVARALGDILRKEGLEEIPVDGKFDPHVHEALLSQPSEAEEGSVVEVIQKGYRLGDRVIRPARVVIAARKANGDDA